MRLLRRLLDRVCPLDPPFAADTVSEPTDGLVGQAADSPTLVDISTRSGRLYEKCQHCHLFVEENDAYNGAAGIAEHVHLSRGDAADERIEATHDAEPSGLVANLGTWMVFGPAEMRERFVTEPREW